jgi:hypothetical protein
MSKLTNGSGSKWYNSIEIVHVNIIRRDKESGALELEQDCLKNSKSTIPKNNFLKMIK